MQHERRERLERERREQALEMAKGEACLVWILATQLVEEEDVMQKELQRKKARIRQKLAIASSFGAAALGSSCAPSGVCLLQYVWLRISTGKDPQS